MRILITGADGFIGKNLVVHLGEQEGFEILTFTRENSIDELESILCDVDFIIHLAGVNRPDTPIEYTEGNTSLTRKLAEAIVSVGCKAPVIYTSSIQAANDNLYGVSKQEAEKILLSLKEDHNVPVSIFRLPNVFGKWARPNYNSVVATFCYNIANDLPIQVNDPSVTINLVHIDDVVDSFFNIIANPCGNDTYVKVRPIYSIKVGELAKQLYRFRDSRKSLLAEPVGAGFLRALYSTYVSYLPAKYFSYEVPKYVDERGEFVEMLKTPDSGQFSYFTALPGVTRGQHYHHTKTEKFLVIKGSAIFKFYQLTTGDKYQIEVTDEVSQIVETIPGWVHSVTNNGDTELIVLLWANEIFDRDKPDTFFSTLISQS